MPEHEDQTHPCEARGCRETVAFDDEPYCFKDSPDSGSSLPGYSYKANHPAETGTPGYVGRHRAAE